MLNRELTARRLLLPLAVQLACAALPAAAAGTTASDSTEEVVVTGTRREGVTLPEASTPIDIISDEKIQRQGASDLNDVLRTNIPSLNVQRFSAQTFSAAVRPFTLRGFAPDQTLVLVNGKRRHRSAAVQISRMPLASGAQGPDLSTIPSIAIEQVEVLRDGAAAQYGSDAIAGVVNFQLKRADHGGSISARYGKFGSGDGEEYTLAGNGGMPLWQGGFFNVSLEYTKAAPTYRGNQVPRAQTLINAGNTAIEEPAQKWGNPDSEGKRLFFNAEQAVGDNAALYLFGNYADADVEANQFWRDPTPTGARADIFASVPLTGSAGGPRFTFASIYPGGITPIHQYEVTDASLRGGFKGEWTNGLHYDFSGGSARSEMENRVYDTVNPSLGPTSPTSFYAGSWIQREDQLNTDFVYGWDTGLFAAPLNVAFGAEYRKETFEIEAGEPDSWRAGPFARVFDPDTGQFVGLAVGASSFPGFQPSQAGSWSRSNWAVYLDLETDVLERLTLGSAVRYEDFSDFGTTFNWKMTGRYAFTDQFALRASYNTGFRAPTPGQSHISIQNTNINLATGESVYAATLPPTDPLSQYFGAQELKPEESKNYSLGAVFNLDSGYLFTLDYFHIVVRDRIGVTSAHTITAADRTALANMGIPLNNTQTVAFFANAFDTETEGFDAVLSKRWLLPYDSALNLSAAANYTRTKVLDIENRRAVDRERETEIEGFNPKWRGNLTANIEQGPFNLMLRANYYGSWTDAVPSPSATSFDQKFSAKTLFDAELGYNITENYRIAVGGENIFNTYPDKERLPANNNNGMRYPQHSPFGYNGGFWYVRATATFD